LGPSDRSAKEIKQNENALNFEKPVPIDELLELMGKDV